jgi:uncharacterized glyoxalase superfamily protein PhnB
VAFSLGDGSSILGLSPLAALAVEAGVGEDGSGFRGVTLSYIVRDEKAVDRVMAEAVKAGAKIVRAAEKAQWGGYFGYFADPDGYLWKVAGGGPEQPFNAE